MGGAIVSNIFPRVDGKKSAYNDWARGQFATSYVQYQKTDKLFLSYWTRSTNTDSEDYGVLKYCRATSSTDAGGGGVYNGVGSNSVSSGRPQDLPTTGSSFLIYTGSDGAAMPITAKYVTMPNNNWVRMEYVIKISDTDVANGFFSAKSEGYDSESVINVTQRTSAKYFQLDTLLLGLDTANPKRWFGISGAVTPDTNYSVTIAGTGNTYTVNSGSSPTLTDVQIIEGLYALVGAAVGFGDGANGASINTAHTQMYIGGPNSGLTHSFTSNLAYDAYGLCVTDIYLDTDSTSRFYLGDSATYATANLEPQKYLSWSDTDVSLLKFTGNLTGTKHLFFVDDSESVTYLGVVS